jgi:hypothetical protein
MAAPRWLWVVLLLAWCQPAAAWVAPAALPIRATAPLTRQAKLALERLERRPAGR